MAARILRWGLLSTAKINRALIEGISHSNSSQVAAVASRSADKANAYAHEWNIPESYGSYEALLADPNIDVIYVSLPNSLHVEWTVKAAQAGKHVLCEKPIALSPDRVDEILAAASENGVFVAEAFMYRHHPQTLKVKEIVESGALGDVQLIRGDFSFQLKNPENVRWDAELGGGSVWDIGCYPISYARYVLDAEPEEVFGWQLSSPTEVDVSFTGQMRFGKDVHAQFFSSFQTPLRSRIEIIGSEGSLDVPEPYKPGERENLYLNKQGRIETISVKGQHLYLGEVQDMENAILHGGQLRLSLTDSKNNVTVISALLESAAQGKSVFLSN